MLGRFAKNEEIKGNGERWRETEGIPQISKYFFILCPSGILMTGQSRWISRTERSSILMTTQFLSKVRILILSSSQPKVTWDFWCNSDTNLEELNIGHCVDNMQNIRSQKNFHKLSLPRCIFEGGSDSKIQVVVVRFPNTVESELMQCAYGILWTSPIQVLELEYYVCYLQNGRTSTDWNWGG